MKFNQEFQWLGEGVRVQKRGSKIHYEAFCIGDLKIRIGDFVLVRNDDALDPEDVMNSYVAQVKDLFDTGEEYDPYQARVEWFSRVLELPTYAIKSLKDIHEFEVVRDKRSSWHNMIDAETIFQKCEVLFLDSYADYELILSEYRDHPLTLFFCRYVFTGTSLMDVKDKDKHVVNKTAKLKSVVNENCNSNGLVSHDDEKVQNDETPAKSKSLKENMYCAIPIGSPTKCPKVLIKRIDDRILESRNGKIRIFVADSNVKNVEDVANIFMDKLKLEKREQQHGENLEKKPIIHSLTFQNNISEGNMHPTKDELIGYDSSVESETSSTPKNRKSYVDRKSAALSDKSRKNLFSYNIRNSPRKNILLNNADIYSSPTKKIRVMIDDLCLKSPSQTIAIKEEDTENISDELACNKVECTYSEKRPAIHFFTSENSNFQENKCETNDELMSDSETESRVLETPKSNKKGAGKRSLISLRNRSCKKTVIDSTKNSPKKTSDSDSETESRMLETPKSNKSYTSKKSSISLLNRSCKKTLIDSTRNSPGKTTVEKSFVYCTPKKKTKFADVVEDFCLTRSGRRVKAVNYSEQQNERKEISTITPIKKKLPLYVRTSCSEDSDSSVFTSKEDSSDSLSDVSLDDISPNKRKSSLKKKTTKKSMNKFNVQTPISAKKSIVNLSIPERKTPSRIPKNPLEESRQRLHVSAVPNSLPCRDEEYSDIYSFVKGCLCAQTGGCMYISGVPGTGKTATVHEVMRNLEEEKESGEIPIFTFIEVNGMWMIDPYQCYVHIFKALTGKSIAPQQAADLLEKRFTERGPKKDAVVLLVDELDRLWTRKQTVMYNIFDWPTKKNSKLIVLAIANTMDLPERMMMNRISSRLGLTRKTFQPYTFKQLQEIIMSRIQELKVFDPDAVQLVARKVAAVSGDARRALDICRFATETVKVGQSTKKGQKILVGMEQVDTALQQMFSSPVISAIRSSSKLAKIFFQCILSEFTRTGLEETTLLKVGQQVVSICRFEGLNPPNSSEISRICADLASSHLILVDNFSNDLYMKIRLNVSSDDVTYALTLK